MSEMKRTDCDNIEITPEMMEAGVEEFLSQDREFDLAMERVRRVYRAMEQARLRSSFQDAQ